mmetsp:Transcript_4174/g.5871  ORF Transcript_4174/g.5871 Transcript_4174/m.5871 type:complete len:268 (-) Transcript_4174:113-916(-)|eukprot:CAMPEP_0170107926 /NCGR_PEP_ID=MMETSP0020_2-20130122/6269_1 /TAXON_ID=98059 /ORGANISM="Dinobryon sp., Strain UTEXLB2267" /LENGTH=267 /DNA_ID=CAMNT_0010332555 /DNA_START=1663 /DNA_END=2466 /DNA_ORIENTATION=-
MGDIGAMFADTNSTSGVYNRTVEQSQQLRGNFSDQFFEGGNITNVANIIKEKRGSKAVGPHKDIERNRMKIFQNRTGIFNYGDLADSILRINKSDRIVKTSWQIALIGTNRLKNTLEPWAGHMSGSPAEILHIWDILTNEHPLKSYSHSVNETTNSFYSYELNEVVKDTKCIFCDELRNDARRRVKAAGTAAFLVAMGYHTAMECIEGTFAYLGEDFRNVWLEGGKDDAGSLFHNGAATSLMSELFNYFTRKDQQFIMEFDGYLPAN